MNGQDYPKGNPNDGPDGCFPELMAGLVIIAALLWAVIG